MSRGKGKVEERDGSGSAEEQRKRQCGDDEAGRDSKQPIDTINRASS